MQVDLLLRGGSVVTFDDARARAAAVAVNDGRIVALGDDGLEDLVGPGTRVVDLHGAAVVPGLVDSHVHFGAFALARHEANLDHSVSLEDGLSVLRSHAQRLEPGQWLRGRGWDRHRWRRLPTAADLDSVVGDRPAALASHDGHALWLNTAAMAAVGLARDTSAPSGGVIERDADGQPSGVVFENAMDLVRTRMPQPSEAELQAAMHQALGLAAAAGLTGIHNLEDARSLAVWRALEMRQQLSLRVYHGLARGQLAAAVEQGLRTGSGSNLLRIGPLKLFADGALGSRTAWLLQPYENATDGYRGVATLQPEEMVHDMRAALAAGLDVAVHAIGDAAVRSVLDAVEAVGAARAGRLVRIEHAQLVHPDDVPRFARLGVIASMQPIHAISDWRAAEAQWGARARHGYAWRALVDAGARVAFGTDAPVERLEPLASLEAATTRVDDEGQPPGGWYAEQRLSYHEAVRAYTWGSADAEGALQRRGSIAPGKDADLVVLDPDPFPLDAGARRQTGVRMTIVGGRVVFEDGRP
ncbi:MAG: amidohydrolase [Chloroflexota bacterium]|nr:amidohydrolase [Chloroflexota bacterium]